MSGGVARPRRYAVANFGCKANAYDGRQIEASLQSAGWEAGAVGDDDAQPELLVVNTCSVTASADRQGRKLARQLARRHPDARVVVTGCGAEIDPAGVAAVPGVAAVVGNQDKHRLADLVADLDARARPADEPAPLLGGVEPYARLRARHPVDREWPLPAAAFVTPLHDVGRRRVFLKVQEGCDAFCTFCIIPYGRGPARSLSADRVVEQVAALCAAGADEVVLTGTNLGDYQAAGGATDGDPRGAELVALAARILAETPLPRLRLTSLDPDEITSDLLALMVSEPRLCPHLHVSLQSPDGAILRRMKRRYRAEAVAARLERVAAASARIEAERGLPGGIFVGMDLICGFPGEDQATFEATEAALRSLPWHRLHVFPYSERAGTAATRLDGAVPVRERKRRVRALMRLSNDRLAAWYRRVLGSGAGLEVLVEGPVRGPDDGGAWVSGTTANYLRVLLPADAAAAGATVRARPVALHADRRAGDAALLARCVA